MHSYRRSGRTQSSIWDCEWFWYKFSKFIGCACATVSFFLFFFLFASRLIPTERYSSMSNIFTIISRLNFIYLLTLFLFLYAILLADPIYFRSDVWCELETCNLYKPNQHELWYHWFNQFTNKYIIDYKSEMIV